MMSKFTVIETGNPLWKETVEEANGDIFYDSSFCEFRCKAGNARPVMFRYEDTDGVVFDVTLLKDVRSLAFFNALRIGLPARRWILRA